MTDTMTTPQNHTDLTSTIAETAMPSNTEIAARQIGRCKWFSKGYGFIQGLGDDTRDFFVHHTQLGRLDASQDTDVHEFRYLMRGETVEFTVKEKPRTNAYQNTDAPEEEGATNRIMACNVTSIYGGPLMYQTELQEQEEQNARYAVRNQTGDAGQDSEFTTVTHRRHGGGRGKGKGRYGGKGRPMNHRWSTSEGAGGGYYREQVPMHHPPMGYYGYYGGAQPIMPPGYGQQLHHNTQGPPPVQNPAGHTAANYNNGFSALQLEEE